MAARKPIVSVGGSRRQLPAADVLITDIPLRYNQFGVLDVSTGATAYEFDDAYTLVSAYFFLQIASSSGSVTIVPRHNGNALGTLTASSGITRSNKLALTTQISAGSKITIDVTAAGVGAESVCVVFTYRAR